MPSFKPSIPLPSRNQIVGYGLGGLAGASIGGSGFQRSLDALRGKDAADAAMRAGELQAQAAREGMGIIREGQTQALGYLSPFQQAGAGQLPGITSLVSDPTAQAAFIQQNPFFQSLAGQASSELLANQAARGKVGSGGTAAALQERLLGLGSNLLNQNIAQRMGIAQLGSQAAGQSANLIGQTSGSIADLIGSSAAAQAAGLVGAANARQQGISNLAGLGVAGLSLLSDERAKKDIKKIGEYKGFNVYSFRYKNTNEPQIGFMAQEVEKVFPNAVYEKDGFKYVDYGKIYAH